MNNLEFLAVKSLISNVNLNQAEELLNMLKLKINIMKTHNIKRSLIYEYNKYDELRKYTKLIEKIDIIEYEKDDIEGTLVDRLIITLTDNPRYKLISEHIGSDFDHVLIKVESTGSNWKEINRNDDPTLYDYLKSFVMTIEDNYEINGNYTERRDKIVSYLYYGAHYFN